MLADIGQRTVRPTLSGQSPYVGLSPPSHFFLLPAHASEKGEW